MSESQLEGSASDIEYLLSTRAIRERAQKIFELALEGKTHFEVNLTRLPEAAKLVTDVTRANYPTLEIPFHSRWSHFQVGGVDRLAGLHAKLASMAREDQTKCLLDLVVVSVLLDAGSGPDWKFIENGRTFARSEGLAVASLHLFLEGAFSSDPNQPLQVDAEGLAKFSRPRLSKGFQVTAENPLAGESGRYELLKSLGKALSKKAEFFGFHPGRPGNLLDYLKSQAPGGKLKATQILTALQRGLGSIWPGRVSVGSLNLGDVWPYAPLGAGLGGLVPFHKLSQWLTYSMIEPIMKSGLEVILTTELTGLAEYRNGGLFLDAGVLALRDPAEATQIHAPGSELIVEWRALTLVLLEKTALLVRENLDRNEEEFPLGKVLEGGTWWAGRKIAAQLRPGGGPPLQISSDGTVF